MDTRDYLDRFLTKHPRQNFRVGIIGERGLIEVINELTERHSNIKLSKLPPAGWQ